jgi:asparagine synthase (glutamine-hydrolysing)
MAGIAGIASASKQQQVKTMLDKLPHRGQAGSKIIDQHEVTLGAVWPEEQVAPVPPTLTQLAAWDGYRPPLPDPDVLDQEREPFALAAALPGGVFLARDPLGICPLYYGWTDDDQLCFASEVKALMVVSEAVNEVPPGAWYDSKQGFNTFLSIEQSNLSTDSVDELATGLRLRLEQAVTDRIRDDNMGCWLSGGLDSSIMAALAHSHVRELHTFAGGLAGAPDLAFARQVADYLGATHHEIIVSLDDLRAALPSAIYHLESFDALLVRSSVTNYLVAQRAADYVGSVFSGEGADELFGGYAYLKQLGTEQLPGELIDITHRLHNTALQRVDRSASAHGLVAHVAFLDTEVVRYAMSIPSKFKVHHNGTLIEKWILRKAVEGIIPDDVLWRTKSKFWQGAGVGDLLAQYAEDNISDSDFESERMLPNNWILHTKEELMYYRIFKEQFGELNDLSWMGRTKGAPRS